MFQNAFGKTYVDSSSSPCRRCRRCAWEIKSLNLQNEVASTTNWHTIYQTYKDHSFFKMSIQHHVLHGCDHWRPETFSFFNWLFPIFKPSYQPWSLMNNPRMSYTPLLSKVHRSGSLPWTRKSLEHRQNFLILTPERIDIFSIGFLSM